MTRVLAFAAALVAAFAAAFGLGSLADDEDSVEPAAAETERPSAHGRHGAEPSAAAPVEVGGLAVAADGLRLVAETTSFTPGRASQFAFRILGEDAAALTDFDVEHERPMHLIVVRRDLAGFQHLHPRMDEHGTWTVPLRLPAAGTYRAFADFVVHGEKRTLGIDLFAPGDLAPLELPLSDITLAETELRSGVEQTLRFDAGGPVERYLGAAGHLVILREGDLGYLHTHADADELEFETTFPSPGRYRAFLQVKRGGGVHTAVFDLGAR